MLFVVSYKTKVAKLKKNSSLSLNLNLVFGIENNLRSCLSALFGSLKNYF